MAITTTNFSVVSTGQSFSIPGAWDAAALVNMYSSTINGLGSMDSAVTEEGDIRTVTFRPRTGTKGAITTTNFSVVSTGQSFSIPGAWDAAALVNMYSSTINGLGSMDSTVTEEGDIRTVTFRPRTGTKG
jgi:Trk-type K+ transport system membrane component